MPAKMIGKALTRGCVYGCCGDFVKPGMRNKGRRVQRRREAQKFRKDLRREQDI